MCGNGKNKQINIEANKRPQRKKVVSPYLEKRVVFDSLTKTL